MRERINHAGICWCGCGERTGTRSFFHRGHDGRAEAAVILVEYGGIKEFLEARGYSPSGKNPMKALEEWRGRGNRSR